MVLLQEFDVKVVHWPGSQHVVKDYLSQLDSEEPTTSVEDDFLDASIFAVSNEKSVKPQQHALANCMLCERKQNMYSSHDYCVHLYQTG